MLPKTTKAYLRIRDSLIGTGRRVQKLISQCIGFHTYEPTEYETIKIEMKELRKVDKNIYSHNVNSSSSLDQEQTTLK